MKRAGKKKHIFGVVLLAFLCIGVMELIFCRFAAPDLYYAIVGPVLDAAETVQARFRPQSAPQPEATSAGDAPEQAQVASKPAIKNTAPIADPVITEFAVQDDRSVLTGGNMTLIYYNQADPDWANLLYGKDAIGRYGCGPTAMSMVVTTMTDHDLDPAAMAAWAAKQGYCAPKSGSYLSIVPGTAEYYGLECTPLGDYTADSLRLELANGGVVVALMGKGHFTNSGHFIILRGVTLTGDILVADPNSRDNSLSLWDPQLILDELSGSRSSGAPLWLIRTVFTV